MRKANSVLSVVAALVLSFQAGTTESNMPLAALGVVFVSVGVWLLRRPRDMSPDK